MLHCSWFSGVGGKDRNCIDIPSSSSPLFLSEQEQLGACCQALPCSSVQTHTHSHGHTEDTVVLFAQICLLIKENIYFLYSSCCLPSLCHLLPLFVNMYCSSYKSQMATVSPMKPSNHVFLLFLLLCFGLFLSFSPFLSQSDTVILFSHITLLSLHFLFLLLPPYSFSLFPSLS